VAHLGFSKVGGGCTKKILVDQVIGAGYQATGRPKQGATRGARGKAPLAAILLP